MTDPRQPAYDAVFAYIRQQPRDFLPATVVDRNAMIWHAVHAALDAMGAPGPEGASGLAATEATEQEKTTRVFAALHRSAERDVTRVINLYEQWVKAGPPPLGVLIARWWDARLVELHEAIRPAAEPEENR